MYYEYIDKINITEDDSNPSITNRQPMYIYDNNMIYTTTNTNTINVPDRNINYINYLNFISELLNLPSFEDFSKMTDDDKQTYLRDAKINDLLK